MGTLKKRPLIGIIANPRSLENRKDLIEELGPPKDGLFNPLKFTYKEFEGEIIPIDVQPNDVLKSSHFFKAKEAMFKAVDYFVKKGSEIICFTASTKRLSGKNGQDVKKLYPKHTFTIGDNATLISFNLVLEEILSGLDKERDEVVCVGNGFIGGMVMYNFLKHGFKNISLVSEQYPKLTKVFDKVEKLPKNIKFMASCSHKYAPDKKKFSQLFTPSATILEVAVPPMVTLDLFNSLHGVNKIDAGDFILKDLEHDFSHEILGFPKKGYWFGCFTEAIMLALAHYEGYPTNTHNFFSINEQNRALLMHYLEKEKVKIPLVNFFDPKIVREIKLN